MFCGSQQAKAVNARLTPSSCKRLEIERGVHSRQQSQKVGSASITEGIKRANAQNFISGFHAASLLFEVAILSIIFLLRLFVAAPHPHFCGDGITACLFGILSSACYDHQDDTSRRD